MNGTTHAFNVDVAQDVGVIAAIVFYELCFWCDLNRKKGQNYKKGSFWTYKTATELSVDLPYLSERQIRYAIEKLIKHDYIRRGNFNKRGFDRTKWYAVNYSKLHDENDTFVSEKSSFVSENDTFVSENGTFVRCSDNFVRCSDNFVRAIPDTNTVTNTVTNRKENRAKKRHFSKPSVDEVRAYCQERKNNVDPERFVSFYESKGWVIGKSPMKDWKAAVRTWEKRQDQLPGSVGANNQPFDFIDEESFL